MARNKANQDNVWKIIAVIFIIICLLESMFILLMFSIGLDAVVKEDRCNIDICGRMEEAIDSYYDDDRGVCNCLNAEGEIIKREFIG